MDIVKQEIAMQTELVKTLRGVLGVDVKRKNTIHMWQHYMNSAGQLAAQGRVDIDDIYEMINGANILRGIIEEEFGYYDDEYFEVEGQAWIEFKDTEMMLGLKDGVIMFQDCLISFYKGIAEKYKGHLMEVGNAGLMKKRKPKGKLIVSKNIPPKERERIFRELCGD